MPSTFLLWREEPMVINNDDEASTSRKHYFDESNHKDPNSGRIRENISHLLAWNSSTFSSEYEWDSLLDASCELGVYFIHVYATQSNVVDESSLGHDEFGSQFSLVDHVGPSRYIPNLDSFGVFPIGLTFCITINNSFHIDNLKSSTSLSLIHPNLIIWSAQHQRPKLPSFQNDYEISCYLNTIEPMISSTRKLFINMMEIDIKYLS